MHAHNVPFVKVIEKQLDDGTTRKIEVTRTAKEMWDAFLFYAMPAFLLNDHKRFDKQGYQASVKLFARRIAHEVARLERKTWELQLKIAEIERTRTAIGAKREDPTLERQKLILERIVTQRKPAFEKLLHHLNEIIAKHQPKPKTTRRKTTKSKAKEATQVQVQVNEQELPF